MKISVPIKIAIWFILFIAFMNIGLEMISQPSTIENVIGFFIVVIAICITIKTKCLTKIRLRKHEKSI